MRKEKCVSEILGYVLDTMRNCLPVHSLPLEAGKYNLDVGLHSEHEAATAVSPLLAVRSTLLLGILPQPLEQEGVSGFFGGDLVKNGFQTKDFSSFTFPRLGQMEICGFRSLAFRGYRGWGAASLKPLAKRLVSPRTTPKRAGRSKG